MYSDLNEIFFSDTKKNKTKQIDYPIRKKRKKYKTKQNIQYIEKSNHQKSLILYVSPSIHYILINITTK